MPTALAASLIDLLLGLTLAPAGPDAGNRLTLEGLTLQRADNGALRIGIERLEARSLRVASGPLVLEIGRLALHQLAVLVRNEGGRPRLCSLDAAEAHLEGLQLKGPLTLSPQSSAVLQAAHAAPPATAAAAPASGWNLGPLASADGSLRAEIVDAHLIFDADVLVPIRQGQVDFNQATVAHVGPDSRMGVSRLGIYVDAPNGRSYLYQFSSAPLAGVQYERRGSLLGRGADRGRLQLQPFLESLLRQHPTERFLGLTEQARLLFDRTAASGEIRLGDGKFAVPGVQAELEGRAAGRNTLRIHSESVGRRLTVDIDALSLREATAGAGSTRLSCETVAGALKLCYFIENGTQLCFAFDLLQLKAAGVHALRSA